MNDLDPKLVENIALTVVRIEERQKAHEKVHEVEDSARKVSYDALQKELESLNDVRSRFLPRGEYTAEHNALELRVESLENFRGKALGAGAAGVSVAGILGGIIGKIWPK